MFEKTKNKKQKKTKKTKKKINKTGLTGFLEGLLDELKWEGAYSFMNTEISSFKNSRKKGDIDLT